MLRPLHLVFAVLPSFKLRRSQRCEELPASFAEICVLISDHRDHARAMASLSSLALLYMLQTSSISVQCTYAAVRSDRDFDDGMSEV